MTNELHLTLKKKWFDLIKSGEKKTEYREIKPYWTVRLFKKKYDSIVFTNGYKKDSPKIKVELLDIGFEKFNGKDCYALKLGKTIEELERGCGKDFFSHKHNAIMTCGMTYKGTTVLCYACFDKLRGF